MRAATFVAALLLFLCDAFAAPRHAAAQRVSPAQRGEEQRASLVRLDAAWHDLGGGRPREAYRAFSRELPFWDALSHQGLGYIDAERGSMIAALFARDDARMEAAWIAIAGQRDAAQPGDKLVFAGRWNDAFRAYRDATQDLAMEHPRYPEHDRIVSAGVERALHGDYRGAIRAWSAPADGGGVYDLTDVQVALIGIANARMRDWPGAESAWVRAARIRRNIPQMAEFEEGNLIALAMLRHFRSQFARGEGQYHLRMTPPAQ